MTKKTKAYKLGLWAETLTVCYLRAKGYGIIARRYKVPVGEVDIIARRKNFLTFIEVKARTSSDTHEILTTKQQQRIARAASLFIAKNPKFATFNNRFDVMIVRPWRVPHHIKNAWNTTVG